MSCFVWQNSNVLTKELCFAKHFVQWVTWYIGRWSPEEEAGLWSRLFFSFCTGLIKMGKAKALNPDDLWDLPYSDEASSVSQV